MIERDDMNSDMNDYLYSNLQQKYFEQNGKYFASGFLDKQQGGFLRIDRQNNILFMDIGEWAGKDKVVYQIEMRDIIKIRRRSTSRYCGSKMLVAGFETADRVIELGYEACELTHPAFNGLSASVDSRVPHLQKVNRIAHEDLMQWIREGASDTYTIDNLDVAVNRMLVIPKGAPLAV